jgi:anti-sigma factor RsiW
MPACSKILNLLVDYLEGRLPVETHAELDSHLSACSSCVAQLRTYKSTISLLHSLHEEDLPDELRMTLHAFLDRRASN